MKAKSVDTKEVELKPGDRVCVYVTILGSTTITSSRFFSTDFTGDGVVVRVYKHIDAVVVKFGSRTQFIRHSDSRYSIWRTS